MSAQIARMMPALIFATGATGAIMFGMAGTSAPSPQSLIVRAQSENKEGAFAPGAKPRLSRHASGAFVPKVRPERK